MGDIAVGAQPGSEGRGCDLGGRVASRVHRGEHRAWILSPPAARPSQRCQEVSTDSGELELRCLSGEMTQKGPSQNSKKPDGERPLPFSCHEVQKGQQWRAPHKDYPQRPTLTGTSHIPTLIQHRAPSNPTQRSRRIHTDPREGPLTDPQCPQTETSHTPTLTLHRALPETHTHPTQGLPLTHTNSTQGSPTDSQRPCTGTLAQTHTEPTQRPLTDKH